MKGYKTILLTEIEIEAIKRIITEADEPILSKFLVNEIDRNTKEVRNDYDFLAEFLKFSLEKYGDDLKNHKGGAVVSFMKQQ